MTGDPTCIGCGKRLHWDAEYHHWLDDDRYDCDDHEGWHIPGPIPGWRGSEQTIIPGDDGVIRECDHCGQVKPCREMPDPFVRDVYNETTEDSWWCTDCYVDRADEV